MLGPLHYRPPRNTFRRDFLTYFPKSLATFATVLAAATTATTGCNPPAQKEKPIIAAQGERVECGNLVFNVLESGWLPQLGQMPIVRMPKHRFLRVRLSVTNGGGAVAGCPLQTIVDDSGNSYAELNDIQGMEEWLGVVRLMQPGESSIGWIVFDAPQTSYILTLTDGLIENEHVGYVKIPFTLDQ